MFLRVRALRKQAGGFNDNVRPDAGPVDFRGIFHFEYFEGFPVDGDGILRVRNDLREIPEDRIVLQQVRESLGVGNVVHGDELNILVTERGAHNVASDAAEAVDPDLNGHTSSDGWYETAASSLGRNGRKAEPKMLW